jgi:hypothetical protein
MTVSIHDNQIISYEVHCENRTITLRTEYREENKPTEFTNVLFEGVQGYHFENDAFGNLIFDVTNFPAEEFLKEYGTEISDLRRKNGRPTWAEDLITVPRYMRENGIRAFILSSSLGLSGWVLAKETSILSARSPS